MNKKWFDFIALLILAIIVANMNWYRGLSSSENFASIIVYIIVVLAFRMFLISKVNTGDPFKKILAFMFKLALVIAIVFGICIYVYNTDEYFEYKVKYFGKSIVLDCKSSEGYLGSKIPSKNLFRVVKPIIDSGMELDMTLLQIIENSKRPFTVTKGAIYDDEDMMVRFWKSDYFNRSNLDINFNRSNLDIKVTTDKDKGILLNHYHCKEVDSQVFDKIVKSFYNNKKRAIKF